MGALMFDTACEYEYSHSRYHWRVYGPARRERSRVKPDRSKARAAKQARKRQRRTS